MIEDSVGVMHIYLGFWSSVLWRDGAWRLRTGST